MVPDGTVAVCMLISWVFGLLSGIAVSKLWRMTLKERDERLKRRGL